jgi:hypothetical protein
MGVRVRGSGIAVWLTVAGLVLAASACGEGDCDPSGNWCEGNVLHACAADGGGRVGTECPAGTVCAGTRCYVAPLEECRKGIEAGWRDCGLAVKRPGTCTDDGYMLWDEGEPCRTEIGEDCLRVVLTADEPAGEALCGYPGAPCTAGTQSCHNQVLQRCSALRIWVTEQDCGAEEKVCDDGQCR